MGQVAAVSRERIRVWAAAAAMACRAAGACTVVDGEVRHGGMMYGMPGGGYGGYGGALWRGV